MKLIRIITNATYGHRVGKRLMPKDKTSEPFEVSEVEAKRLVDLEVAAYVKASDIASKRESDNTPDTDLPPSGVATPAGGENSEGAGGNSGDTEKGAEGAKNDTPADDDGEEDDGDGGAEDADIPEYRAEMALDDLKDIFKDCGLTYKVGMSKADMVAYLDEHFAADDDGDIPPLLNPEGPVT